MSHTKYASIMVLGVAFFAFAAWFMYGKWETRTSLGMASESWPTVPATATSFSVERVDTSVNRHSSSSFQPRIGFSYEVDGLSYYSNTFAATVPGFRTREKARAWLDAYPREGLLAHYDPDDPSHAVLETGVPWAWHLVLLIPIACAATALFLAWSAIRGPGAQQAAETTSQTSEPDTSPAEATNADEATSDDGRSRWSLAERAERSKRPER